MFRETGEKVLEMDVLRFTHFTAHRALLLGKGVNRKQITKLTLLNEL